MTKDIQNDGTGIAPEMMEKLLRKADPLNDVLFRFLFANERNGANTLRLLNDAIPDRTILDFEYRGRQRDADRGGVPPSYFDVRARAEDGQILHVGVQLWHEATMFERVLYHAFYGYTHPLISEGGFYAVNSAVFIILLKNTLFNDSPEIWRTTSRLMDRQSGMQLDCLSLYFFELDKLERLFAEGKVEDDSLTRLLRYLGRMGGEGEMEQLAQSDAGIAEIRRNEREFFREPENLATYIIRQREEIDCQNAPKQAAAEALQQGQMTTLFSLVDKRLLSVHDAADQAGMTIREFEAALSARAEKQ